MELPPRGGPTKLRGYPRGYKALQDRPERPATVDQPGDGADYRGAVGRALAEILADCPGQNRVWAEQQHLHGREGCLQKHRRQAEVYRMVLEEVVF